MLFLTRMPLSYSTLLVVVLPTVLAMVGPLLVRRRVSLTRLSTNNEVAGFKFAVVGVLYAVMVAFAVVVVWEKFDEAEQTVTQEAGAAATLYRLSRGLEPAVAQPLQEALTRYLQAAVEVDWPAMNNGGSALAVSQDLTNLYTVALRANPTSRRDSQVMSEMLRQLDSIGMARRTRLVLAEGIMPGVVWATLAGGAVLTIGFTFFFGTENLRAQTMMTGMLTALIFSALLVTIAIDRPFTGPVFITPHALELVLAEAQSLSK
ncbi:MAG TPA: DUF4239 domain-containing protein [Acetobacteraceae bacterium]|nr:DUF4239 domain-containing protein [Acetobacteraceae bacterium]